MGMKLSGKSLLYGYEIITKIMLDMESLVKSLLYRDKIIREIITVLNMTSSVKSSVKSLLHGHKIITRIISEIISKLLLYGHDIISEMKLLPKSLL